MRRLFAGMVAGLFLASVGLAAEPAVTRPESGPASSPASAPATRPASRPSTRALATSRAARDDKRKEDARREEEAARLASFLTNIPVDAEVDTSEINALSSKYTSDPITAEVDSQLYVLLGEIGPGLVETDRVLSQSPSLETLRQLDVEWTQYARTLDGWFDDLHRRDEFLKSGVDKLGGVYDAWRGRRRAAGDALANPDLSGRFDADAIQQLVDRSKVVREQAKTLLDNFNWEHLRAGNLQLTISAAKIRVRNVLSSVQDAQRKAQDRLLEQDSPTLWSALIHSSAQANVAEQGRNSLDNQWRVLRNYVARQRASYLWHLAGVMALAAGLIWLRRQTRQWTLGDPSLRDATRVFQTPIATAITVSMILTPWIYPAAPRLFWGILGTAALVPTIMVLRPLIERSLRPLLYGLAGASFINLLLSIVAGLPLVYRLLFLVQTGGAAVFFVWFLRTGRGAADGVADPAKPPLRKAAVVGARFGLFVTLVAFAANVFGFVSLSRLMGSALLTSAYLGVLLDTSVHVVDALLLGASHIKPINTLGMVQRHRPLLLKRLHLLLSVLAVMLWGYFTLDALSIRTAIATQAKVIWAFPKDVDTVFARPVVKDTAATAGNTPVADTTDGDATTQPADIDSRADADIKARADADAKARADDKAKAVPPDPGSADTLSNTLYVGGVINFCLVLAASFYVSRFIAFLLDEDVYPRMHLPRGMPYAISTLLKYVVLAIGFTLAIAKLGYNDMTKLTILVSAFGVGLGFGMQNIVNNFVSGLILLFERPVQVGDIIELDNVTGVITRIGIRASVIRTPLAAEIIIPNGRLISDRVVNWTLSNRQRGVELALTVAPGVEPQKLIQLLCSTAKGHPLVAPYPSPQAFFTDFSGGGMKFEVRAWTNEFKDWSQVRSELAVAINAMLVKENITLK